MKFFRSLSSSPAHPLSANRFVNATPNSPRRSQSVECGLYRRCAIAGRAGPNLDQETNPRLSLMVFPEIHHASHQMWHTVEPTSSDLQRSESESVRSLCLRTCTAPLTPDCRALIGFKSELGPSWFSRSMECARHLVSRRFLVHYLCERGFSRIANWSSQSWRKRALSLFAANEASYACCNSRKLYYKLTPATATHTLARPTMLPSLRLGEHPRIFSANRSVRMDSD